MTNERFNEILDIAIPFSFKGPVSQLLRLMRDIAENYELPDMPNTPEALGIRLHRQANELHLGRGLQLTFTHDGKQRLVIIKREAPQATLQQQDDPPIAWGGAARSAAIEGQGNQARAKKRLDWETGKSGTHPNDHTGRRGYVGDWLRRSFGNW